MMTPAGEIDQASLRGLCRSHHVRRLAVFGSVARGDARPDSDIDLLVDYDPAQRVTYFDLVDLSDRLGALFGDHRPVDLVTEQALHPLIRKHVRRELVVLYEG
jgi:predicted nucleotidyltransferase